MTRPRPKGVNFTVAGVAMLFGLAPKTIRNLLSAHRALFSAARYTRARSHPRRLRVLTEREVERLRHLLPVRVKPFRRGTQTCPADLSSPRRRRGNRG